MPKVKENVYTHEFMLGIFIVKYSQLDIAKTKTNPKKEQQEKQKENSIAQVDE